MVKSIKFINFDSPLFYFFPTTYYPISKRCMKPQDFDSVTDLISNSTLRHLGRSEEYVLRTNAAGKEKDMPRYSLERKERSKLNG